MSARVPRVSVELTVHTEEVTREVEKRVNDALNKIGVHWMNESRRATPVDSGRLRSSISFSTPTVHGVHTEHYKGNPRTKAPGGIVTYYRPPPPPLTVVVGTNVEYAAPVHEGITAQVSLVRRHWVRPFTRSDGVSVRGHYRGPFLRNTPARNPTKFIEGPGRRDQPQFRAFLVRALRGET